MWRHISGKAEAAVDAVELPTSAASSTDTATVAMANPPFDMADPALTGHDGAARHIAGGQQLGHEDEQRDCHKDERGRSVKEGMLKHRKRRARTQLGGQTKRSGDAHGKIDRHPKRHEHRKQDEDCNKSQHLRGARSARGQARQLLVSLR